MTYLTSRSSGILILSLLFLFLVCFDVSSAQHPVKPKLNSLSPSFPSTDKKTPPSELKILGVMVEFQPDTNRFTSGNGTFSPGSIPYLENPGTNIDALPHDQNYFEAHLEFVKNYFEKVSDSQISVDYQVLPDIYILNKKMAEYSPIGENPDLSEMKNLISDVWALVGQNHTISTEFDSGDNIAFVIFHAGIGRDVELTGTNLDKTPQDLPSFYLSKQTLSDFLDDPSFSGFPIKNGDLLVDNSLIVPRTLTRAGTDAVGNQFILPLSINGLLTAQIGSHLGLPDLFNTETGRSGIGRFGLMDGAGIFSYNGLFPPEISAWEKSFLGWETPFLVESDIESTISLPAVSNHNNKSIAKIPISAKEYYLVENRHREPDNNGVTFTIKRPDGTYVNQTFTNQDGAIINQESGFDNLLEPGVVVDVSNYDFSLPGGIITENDGSERELNGGILVWHIDEGIIDSKIEEGGINNNPDRKGVDLEEADGAQDIGLPTSIGLSQNEVNGSPFDFWWLGNNARVVTQSDTIQFYENRFGPNTKPANNSNSGSPTNFELFNFSENLPVAHFSIRPVNPFSDLYELWDTQSNLQIETASIPDDPYWQRYPLAVQPMKNGWIMIPGYNGIRFYSPGDRELIDTNIERSSLQQPFLNETRLAIAENPFFSNNSLTVQTYSFENQEITKNLTYEVQPNGDFISSFQNNILDIDDTPFRIDLTNEEILQDNQSIQYSDRIGSYQSRIESGSLIIEYPGGSETYVLNQGDEYSRKYTGIVQSSQNRILFYLFEDDKLSLFKPDDDYKSRTFIHDSEKIEWPAIADFNRDGSPDFLFIDYSANQLIAKNVNGAFLSSFPLSAPQNVRFTGTPLVADINGDDNNELIITGYDQSSMNLYAFDEEGNPTEGFPLLVGGIKQSYSHPIHPLIFGDKLFAVSHFGELKVWEFLQIQNIQWRSKYGNQTTNKVSGFLKIEEPSNPALSLLNGEETYNWPNPARDETQIRFQTREPAEVRIKVLTMSGRIISDQTLQSKGNVSEEILLDTSSWASGGYYALVEAKAGGKKEHKLVKIAIAR
ncbi:MAG: T9SS type A sorting domain-containing protein [Balneolaceae bacterium]|nr:T9SS type A sorting domain-containing protein [Balneolaceae bacterium]